MTHDQNHPEHAQESNQPMSIAVLLRAAADGELTDCQCEQLDAYMAQNPDAESQIGFEKALKDCCGRVMTKPCCPDVLRNKILAMAGSAEDDQAYAERIQASNQQTRSPSFWSRSPMIGIAAALLIMVAGTMIWQSASFSNINDAPSSLNVQQASYYNRVSNFVIDEHNRCCNEKAAKAKFIEHDMDQAVAYFSDLFESQVVIPDMNIDAESIEFFGGGDCQVPSTSRSGHLRFNAIASDGKHIPVSLFISPDPELLPMEAGTKTYPMNSKACSEAGVQLFGWTNNGIQYLLVSEASDEMCSKVRQVMRAPSDIGAM